MDSTQYGDVMSWQQYVKRHLAGRSQAALADLVDVSQTAVSRWLKGTQGVDAGVAIRFARAVGDEPLAALIEAGFLTPEEAQASVARTPDYSQLSNDELLDLVRARMREVGGRDAQSNTAPMNDQDDGGQVVTFPEPDPPPPLDAAARDLGEPSQGELIRGRHDGAGEQANEDLT